MPFLDLDEIQPMGRGVTQDFEEERCKHVSLWT